MNLGKWFGVKICYLGRKYGKLIGKGKEVKCGWNDYKYFSKMEFWVYICSLIETCGDLNRFYDSCSNLWVFFKGKCILFYIFGYVYNRGKDYIRVS